MSATSVRSVTGASPPASRVRRPGWRDPRLAVGVVLVCASALLGARLLDRADDTVAVLAAQGPLVAGQEVEPGDLVAVRLRFSSAADADRYLPGDAQVAPGTVATREVGAGELVPRAAIAAAAGDRLVEVPLAVPVTGVPASVGPGARVDVWVTRPRADGGTARAEQVLRAVAVLATGRGNGAVRQVVVGVPTSEEAGLARVVAALPDAAVVLVRRPQ